MEWVQTFAQGARPDALQIEAYVASPQWPALRSFIERTYAVEPTIEYSKCSGAPGWNMKYRKSSRALCTLYPAQGFFTCLISIGTREAMEAELVLTSCSAYVQRLYKNTASFNGAHWLMIDVTDEAVLADVKKLLCVRARPPKKSACPGAK